MEGGGEYDAAGWSAAGGGGVTRRRAAAPRSPHRLGRHFASVWVLQVRRVDTCWTISVFSEAVVIRTAPGHPPPHDLSLTVPYANATDARTRTRFCSSQRRRVVCPVHTIHTQPTFWNLTSVPLRRKQLTLQGNAFHYLSYHMLKIFNLLSHNIIVLLQFLRWPSHLIEIFDLNLTKYLLI